MTCFFFRFSSLLSICVFVPDFTFTCAFIVINTHIEYTADMFNCCFEFTTAGQAIQTIRTSEEKNQHTHDIVHKNTYKQEIRDFLLLFLRWTQYFLVLCSHDFALISTMKLNIFFLSIIC